MSAIIDQDKLVKSGTSASEDDIFVNKSVVNLDYVKRYLKKYGLESKEGEQIGDDAIGVRVVCAQIW